MTEVDAHLKTLRNYLSGTFYQEREGGVDAGYNEILEAWGDYDKNAFLSSAEFLLENIDHYQLSELISKWLFWIIDDPISWLQNIMEMIKSGVKPLQN